MPLKASSENWVFRWSPYSLSYFISRIGPLAYYLTQSPYYSNYALRFVLGMLQDPSVASILKDWTILNLTEFIQHFAVDSTLAYRQYIRECTVSTALAKMKPEWAEFKKPFHSSPNSLYSYIQVYVYQKHRGW